MRNAENPEPKHHTFRFRAVNRNIFDAIQNGEKKIETRAATPKYRRIQEGDTVILVCGASHLTRTVKTVRIFKSVRALTRVHKPHSINPSCQTVKELEAMYFTFPNYREKLKKYGIAAFELRGIIKTK